MLKYFYITIAVFFLNCKNNNISQNKISTNDSSNTNAPIESNTSIDSILNWKDQQIGSALLLNDFPKFWSYTSTTNKEYDSNSKNKFNILLEDIDNSNNIPIENDIDVNIDYTGDNDFIPYYDSFYQSKEEVSENSFKPVRVFKLNKNIFVSFFERKTIGESRVSKRLDIIVYNNKNKIIDGLNICLIGNGDQHAYSNNFYIKNGIIYLRNFYIYDGESSSSRIFQYNILNSGNIVPYLEQKDGEFKNESENGKIKNNTKNGDWVEIRPNRFVEENTYLEATYHQGKSIGKWNYYNLVDDNKKGTKLLMTEEYSKDGVLLKREIFRNQ